MSEHIVFASKPLNGCFSTWRTLPLLYLEKSQVYDTLGVVPMMDWYEMVRFH